MTGDDPETLRALSVRCRRMARGASTGDVARSLNEMAEGYEAAAARASTSATMAPASGAAPRYAASETRPLPDRDE